MQLDDYISTTLLLLLDLFFGVGTSKKWTVCDVYPIHVSYSMYLLQPAHCRYQYTTTTTTTTTTNVIIVVAVLVTLNILIFLAYHSKSPNTPSVLRCASNILRPIRSSSTLCKYSNQLEMLSLGDTSPLCSDQ